MRPEKLQPDDPRLRDVLALIQGAFRDHDGRIDPPSSMHRLTLADLSEATRRGEIWALGHPPRASVILTPVADALNLSKLAVAADARGQGLARVLVDHAATRARALGFAALELQTRVELIENHTAFQRLGFVRIGEVCHPGFSRPTSIRMRRSVMQDQASDRA